MKRIGIGILLLGLLVSALPALAENPKLVTSSGEVVAVDAAANAVTVKVETTPGETTEMAFSMGTETKIVKQGQAIGLDKVMPGDKVTISFKTVNGKNVAVNVGVVGKPAA
jgi:Cu/Ag efflux protein CusF